MRYNYIAIEGNIGAGKTSLARIIAGKHHGRLILERFEDNSFLPKFYAEPVRYAFPLEMSFLTDRYQQLKESLSAGDLFNAFYVADYFIEKSLIFASKNLQKDEFALFSRVFHIIDQYLPRPDLLVYLYLGITKLKANIKKRGRDYEMSISENYLQKIQEGYLDFIKTHPERRIVVIDTSEVDFVNNADDLEKMIKILESDFAPGVQYIIP
jgi:deoxyadenosine/deoxycytidine kinase